MRMNRQELGRLGEQLARRTLKRRGYRILETNFRCRRGEIDIVAQQNDCLVFVEVRTKSNLKFGSPEESITEIKKKRLVSSALTYMATHQGIPDLWRIDVVAIEMNLEGKPERIEVIEDAVN